MFHVELELDTGRRVSQEVSFVLRSQCAISTTRKVPVSPGRCTRGLALPPTEQGSAAGSSPPRCSRPREAQLYLDANVTCTDLNDRGQHQGRGQMLPRGDGRLYIINCTRGYFIIGVLFEEESATVAQTVPPSAELEWQCSQPEMVRLSCPVDIMDKSFIPRHPFRCAQ